MGKRQDPDGLNSRFSPKRNSGHVGEQGFNISPRDTSQSWQATDPAANYDSPDPILEASRPFQTTITVTQVFDGAATITVGTTADPDLLVTLADAVDLTQLGTTVVTREVAWPADGVARAVIGGAPTQGAATVVVDYTV